MRTSTGGTVKRQESIFLHLRRASERGPLDGPHRPRRVHHLAQSDDIWFRYKLLSATRVHCGTPLLFPTSTPRGLLGPPL
jgi:hypothetical protein